MITESNPKETHQSITEKSFESLKLGVFFMMTSKSLPKKDQDFTILSASDIPSWLELNTLYFFTLEIGGQTKPSTTPRDSTAPDLMIRPLEIQHLQLMPGENSSFNIVILTKDSAYMTSFDHASDCVAFDEVVNHARDLDKETQRSKRSAIDWSVEAAIQAFEKEGFEAIKALVSGDIDRCFGKNAEIDKFENRSGRAYEQLEKVWLDNQVLDCLQAHRPFRQDILEAYLKEFHLLWTSRMNKIWKATSSDMDVSYSYPAN